MMMVTLQPTTLDTRDGDADALLVYRDDRLLAVASKLGPAHDAGAGSLYLEAVFGARDIWTGTSFADEDQLVQWASSVDAQPFQQVARLSRQGI